MQILTLCRIGLQAFPKAHGDLTAIHAGASLIMLVFNCRMLPAIDTGFSASTRHGRERFPLAGRRP
jgi:hypothetical protein